MTEEIGKMVSALKSFLMMPEKPNLFLLNLVYISVSQLSVSANYM